MSDTPAFRFSRIFGKPEKEAPKSLFPQTRWTLVTRSKSGDTREASAALEELCALYWKPLYLFLRRTGRSEHDAQDATQEFFAHILTKDLFHGADADRGRLRTFLLTSLRNFTADRGRTERAEKRGGGAAPLSIDFLEAERGFEAASAISPEKEFEFRWATTLLQNAMDRVRESYEASGKADLFEGLKPLLSWNARSRPQHEVAAELGLSDSAMRVALHRLRSRFGDAVRELVSDTVSKPEEIDDEIQHLFRALSKG